jgi:hypothetical protein
MLKSLFSDVGIIAEIKSLEGEARERLQRLVIHLRFFTIEFLQKSMLIILQIIIYTFEKKIN